MNDTQQKLFLVILDAMRGAVEKKNINEAHGLAVHLLSAVEVAKADNEKAQH